jgi:hypothetical protein
MSDTYDKLKEGMEKAKELPYTNGMATEKVQISTISGDIEIIRKCGSLDRPEVFLFIIKPNHSYPNIPKIKSCLEKLLGIDNTDINVVAKDRYDYDNQYTIVVPVSLF